MPRARKLPQMRALAGVLFESFKLVSWRATPRIQGYSAGEGVGTHRAVPQVQEQVAEQILAVPQIQEDAVEVRRCTLAVLVPCHMFLVWVEV